MVKSVLQATNRETNSISITKVSAKDLVLLKWIVQHLLQTGLFKPFEAYLLGIV